MSIKENLIYSFYFLLFICLPQCAKCDMGETISSCILFILLTLFICAGLGWYSQKQDNENK
jgi:hypothetical protein